MSELLRAKGLRKTFVDGSGQGIEVLKGIDLRVGHGESLSIMGQSGSGKSTLLYILGGLDAPTEGAVFCGREDVHRRKPVEIADWRNSRLGFVFQTHHLMKDFNARENVAMPAFIASKTGKAEALERADRILRRLGLKHRLDQRVIHLSGGEQQRVSIARALGQRSPTHPCGRTDGKPGRTFGRRRSGTAGGSLPPSLGGIGRGNPQRTLRRLDARPVPSAKRADPIHAGMTSFFRIALFRKRRLVLLVCLCCLPLPSLLAQSSQLLSIPEANISEIDVAGLNSIDVNRVLAVIDSQVGKPLNARAVSNDIKNIFELAYFGDVKAAYELNAEGKVRLTFTVVEKTTVEAILFEGNTILEAGEIALKLETLPFQKLDEIKVKRDLETIRRQYIEKGYYNIGVSFRTEAIDSRSVRLIFEISEDFRAYLSKIDITVSGKPFFYPIDLKRRLISGEADCFAWLKSTGIYDDQRINQDLAIITQAYFREGYIQVRIDRPQIKLVHDGVRSRFEVSLHVTEGERFFVGDVTFDALDDHELLMSEEEMRARLNFKTGDVFNPFLNQRARISLNDFYQEDGYAFSFVNVREDIDEENRRVNLRFSFFQGEKAYINRNQLGRKRKHQRQGHPQGTGNPRQRTLQRRQGETKPRESGKVGFFFGGSGNRFRADAHHRKEPGRLRDQGPAVQHGKRQRFHHLQRQYRLRSAGAGVQAQFQRAGAERFPQPFRELVQQSKRLAQLHRTVFSGRGNRFPLLAEFCIHRRLPVRHDPQGSQPGILLFNMEKLVLLDVRFPTANRTFPTSATKGAFPWTTELPSTRTLLRNGIVYFTVNNPQFPSNGVDSRVFFTEAVGLLGGNEFFRELDYTYQYFQSLSKDSRVVAMAKFSYSRLFGKNGDPPPAFRRYRIGGPFTVRGFDFREIEGATSPAEFTGGFSATALNDSSSDRFDEDKFKFYTQNRGGNTQAFANFELLFPLTREGFNVRGVLFFDVGNVWQDGDAIYELTGARNDLLYLRKSYGFGIRLIVGGLGVMRFEYGNKIDKREGESPGQFHFNISSLF